ncbi:DNA translocase FtsK [Brachyspira hyodysenteriae]|uniref:DNA translocase FtsK n=1 Tax=Brachyspira hyodysenteriae TaxID=159 RepID=UPI0011831EE7|nr:DNA translocase FtsK [Brachyspira hyodysenteriae]TVL61786.1 cell division protein FtsK [Brachyspira hyodysenteriae]TVL77172.1 cell division protein FtsK [Brachyspira hyodysenteriae]
MMGLFKRKLTIQKRAEQKKFEQKSENENFDDYIHEEYENRNPFFDIVGFLCLLFAGILLLSYFSMNMEDLNSNNEIKNLLGIFGAYISSYSFLAFGFASYVIPAFFIYAGVNIILKNSTDRILISALSSSILMILLSILLNIFLGSLYFYNKGGMLGEFIGGSLVSIFGKTGAIMIVIAGLVITAIIFAKLSIMDLVNYFRDMVRNVDFDKIKDIEQKVVNGIKDLEIKSMKNTETSLQTDNKEKTYSRDYIPLFDTKEISELEFKTVPFIEKVENNNYNFDEKKYRENLLRKNNSANSFFTKTDSFSKETENITNELKNMHFNGGINVNALENREEDLGLTLAEVVFGKEKANRNNINHKSSMEMEDEFYRSYYNDFINKKKNEELEEAENNDYEEFEGLDYNINYLKKSDFKRAAYDDSFNNYAKYNVEDQYIRANSVESYENYMYDYSDINKKEEETNVNENTDAEDSFEKLQKLIEENKKNKENELNEVYEVHNNIDNIVETKKEEEKKEYVLTSNNIGNSINSSKKKKEAFEFAMGYASKREYNRADHIPNYNNHHNNYTDSKIDEFDLDEEELYNADSNIEDIRLKTRSINTENNIINENLLESNNLNNASDNIKENSDIENNIENNNAVTTPILKESEEINEDNKEDDKYNNETHISNAPQEEAGFINIESQKTVDTLKPMKSVIGTKSIKNLDTERIQSNFDTKYVDKHYKHPPFDLLNRSIPVNDGAMMESIKQTAMQLEHTLLDFNIEAKVTGVSRGPVITRYELEIASGIRVSKISNLTDNIALALASESVRIIAPIPGRSVIGIEIPNKVRSAVYLRDVLESTDFRQSKLDIPFVLGKGIYGNNVVSDMSEAPHLLVAGTTGSGKSVCLSTIILSLLYKFRPDELKFIFVDKKRVELSIYNGIPHLMSPVVSDEKKATIVLRYIVDIMEKRYERMERFFVRNVKTYNEKVRQLLKEGETEFNGEPLELFPYIVLVIDELHNLMVVASKEVEDLISRLAGMSRAVGIHLIIATQRPSADVVTGVIKANLPTRIAFQVPNKTNSRIIIDMSGAEQLLGKGDALFCASGSQMPDRVQGAFVSDNEVKKVVDYLSGQMSPMFDESLIAALEGSDADDRNTDEEDILDEELWEDAVQLVARTGKASASFLQRRLKIGYNRAARIVEIMERQGIVGPENGSKPREVLITLDE